MSKSNSKLYLIQKEIREWVAVLLHLLELILNFGETEQIKENQEKRKEE